MVKRNLLVVAALAVLAAAMPATAATTAWFTFADMTYNGNPIAALPGTVGGPGLGLVINKPADVGTYVIGVDLWITTDQFLASWNYDLQSTDALAANGSTIKGIGNATFDATPAGFTKYLCGQAFDGGTNPKVFGATNVPGTLGVIYDNGGGANLANPPAQARFNGTCKVATYHFTVTKAAGMDAVVDIRAATGGTGTTGGSESGSPVAVSTTFGGSTNALNGTGARTVANAPTILINNIVPEPATLSLLVLGSIVALRRRK